MCLVYGNKSTDIKTFSGIARCKLNTFQLILDTRGAHLTDKKQTKLDNYKKYNCHHRFVFDTVYMVNHFVKYWPLMLLPYSKRIKIVFTTLVLELLLSTTETLSSLNYFVIYLRLKWTFTTYDA